ncbi:MAG TPA: hypothetical protein VIQ97_05440 [Prevotella sp.]
MDKEDKTLKERLGAENPFTVPDGYFDTLADTIMAKLPEQQARMVEMRPRRRRYYRLVGAVAASVCAVVFGLHFFIGQKSAQTGSSAQVEASYAAAGAYSAIDQTADYTMLDNEDIYAYVSNE